MHRITPVIYNGSPQSRWQNHVLVAEQSKDGGFPTSFAQHTRKKVLLQTNFTDEQRTLQRCAFWGVRLPDNNNNNN